jgi:RNA polymerase-binding transcription factor DksA
MAHDVVNRYSDDELAEFREIIEKKLAMAQEQLTSLREQIVEISENTGDEHGGDWVDDSSTNSDIEMLGNMAVRQQKYIQDLNNALLRIQNKVYGICVITGELIDKRRLRAVPTTTKSLTAKTDIRRKEEQRMTHRITDNPYVRELKENAKKKPAKPKVISKKKKKPSTPSSIASDLDEDNEDLTIDELDLDAMGEDTSDDED